MRCDTTLASAKKYPNSYMIWATEIATLRNNPNQDVYWYIGNKFTAIFSSSSILSAVDNREGTFHPYKNSYWLEIPYSKLTTNTQGQFPFIDAHLHLKSQNDKIVSFNTTELGLSKATQHSVFDVVFELPNNVNVTIPFISNRANESTLAASIDAIPRGIKLPKVGYPVKVKVRL